MAIVMAYDFETTGLPLWNEPSEHPGQPHIVQAAALLVDVETKETVARFEAIAQPTDWVIPDDVVKIHGITTERAREVGIPEMAIVRMILNFHDASHARLAHNESFDQRIMRIAMKRFEYNEAVLLAWAEAPVHCTQRLSTPILNLPPTDRMLAANRRGPKPANLTEAYEHFTGNKMVGAHGAMADCRACMAVYLAILGAADNAVPEVL